MSKKTEHAFWKYFQDNSDIPIGDAVLNFWKLLQAESVAVMQPIERTMLRTPYQDLLLGGSLE